MSNSVGLKLFGKEYHPAKKHDDDACYDCYARLKGVTEIEVSSRNGNKFVLSKQSGLLSINLEPGQRAKIPLGFALELPVWMEAQVRPRSGMTSESKDAHFGTIDSNYRGEVRAIFENATSEIIKVQDGMRIAQLAIREIPYKRKSDLLDRFDKIIYRDDFVDTRFDFISKLFHEILENDVVFVEKDELSETDRGANGFGSTGNF